MNPNRWNCGKSEGKIDQLEETLTALERPHITIIAHNNPDPDSIAGCYAFQFLLKERFNIDSTILYGGFITRAENQAMVQRLRIPMTRVTKVDWSRHENMAIIDAQPGSGNNLLPAKNPGPIIIIDHHPPHKNAKKAVFSDIRPEYGATSTIITEYLLVSGLTPSRSVANALLYGIKTDTNSLMRGSSDSDLKAIQYLSPLTNPKMLGWIEKPALPLQHFREYHRGLSRTTVYRDVAVCYLGRINSESIIPRLADDLLRIDGVSWALCMGKVEDMLMISARSTSKTYAAGNVLRKLVGRIGFAGGHREMAGGQVPITDLNETQADEMAQGLVTKFLKLIKREAAQPKPLVGEREDRCLVTLPSKKE
jgi:nanoRNase/pAp phosphatase (c-di-AMP/oligoRNAs hydrolase)